MRHVGESAFLEDQVDQLQNFESLLRLQPEGLWGAIMSGTVPPARALGPLGAIVFGVPVSLGLGVDSRSRQTSLLIAIATAVCFAAFARIDAVVRLAVAARLLGDGCRVVERGDAVVQHAAAAARADHRRARRVVSPRSRRATLGWLAVAVLYALQLHWSPSSPCRSW